MTTDFSIRDVCRIGLHHSSVAAGIPLEGLAAHLGDGAISLAWSDSPAYDRRLCETNSEHESET